MSCGKVKQNTLTDTFRKKRRRKTAKKKKRKRTAPPAWRSGLSRFCRRKLCPQGVIFDGQTAQPPDLDGPTETGYLCGSFLFLTTSIIGKFANLKNNLYFLHKNDTFYIFADT